MKPVVLVSVPHGGAAGNVLRTGLIRRLIDAPGSPDLVVISPLVGDPAFVGEFEHPRVSFENLPPHRPSGLEGRLMAIIQAAYIGSGVTESVKIRRAEAARNKTIRWIRTKRRLAAALVPSIIRKESRYALIDRLVSHPWAERLFDRYRPALLVASSPGLIFSEVPLLRTCVRRGVRSMAVDPSWDNFTNKLLPVRRVNRLIVWNDLMREQAVNLHGYAPDEVRVAGAPQWDLYFQSSTPISRDAFFRRIGADPSRRLITLTTTPRELYSHHDHVLSVLIRAMNGHAWSEPAAILVRLHPRDDLDAYRPFQGVPNVIIEKPFRPTVKTGDGLAIDITADNQQHLADTLRHSDVIVNVASTIAIEAAIFDTPIVNVSFDGEAPSEWTTSARRYYRFTHYVNLTRHGAVRVADRPEELVEYIGRYLDNPSLDRDDRRRVVLEQCQFLDGRSAERVANYVVQELADVTGGRGMSRSAPTEAEPDPCAALLDSSR
jgi:CDP-glycerol:poly(glycerophosphate) glycerophosphotransferase